MEEMYDNIFKVNLKDWIKSHICTFICPECGMKLYLLKPVEEFKYCPSCGQSLDLSDSVSEFEGTI